MMKLLSIDVVTITPHTAASFLNFNTFKYQRPTNAPWITVLSDRMKRGVYVGANIVFGNINGVVYLMDGQHTLMAIINSGTTQKGTVKKIQCDFDEDITMLYQQYDGGRIRSIRDHSRAEAGLLGIDWPAKVVAAVISGGALIRWGLNRPKDIPKDEKVKVLGEFAAEGEFVYEICRQKGGEKTLLRVPVVAAMMQSYGTSKDDALFFWEGVRDGEMLRKTSPIYHLREFLVTTDTRGSRQKTATNKEFYAKCCKAWNAYVLGAEMKRLTFGLEEKVPTLIQTLPSMCAKKAA